MIVSPIQSAKFLGYTLHIKRDDLLHPLFGGNKWRKLSSFLHSPLSVKRIVSYGSMQSNAMVSLAYFAKIRELEFVYYSRINEDLLASPKGNLAQAFAYGMKLCSLATWPYTIGDINYLSESHIVDQTLIIPEGLRCKEAYIGMKELAKELIEWCEAQGEQLPIFLPSGTGTTALWLQKALIDLGSSLQVFTVPCVGDSAYLSAQMQRLEPNTSYHPAIIQPPKRYRFAKLYRELYEIWQEAYKQTGVIFDLLYDPIALQTLRSDNPLPRQIIYLHQGGISGNITMEERYKKKFATI